MQLIAGRVGQEFNQRKNRKGAFWEDRYHATAIEKGEHLFRCFAYIDLNMVRAGVVEHPSQWPFSGYNEIQKPRKKNVLINYDKLMELTGAVSYEQAKQNHRGWVEEYLKSHNNQDDKWTESVAVGSKEFLEKVIIKLGAIVKGRKTSESGEGYQLREPSIPYNAHLGAENSNIGPKNTYYWNIYS